MNVARVAVVGSFIHDSDPLYRDREASSFARGFRAGTNI
jgi:hypothetical protein